MRISTDLPHDGLLIKALVVIMVVVVVEVLVVV